MKPNSHHITSRKRLIDCLFVCCRCQFERLGRKREHERENEIQTLKEFVFVGHCEGRTDETQEEEAGDGLRTRFAKLLQRPVIQLGANTRDDPFVVVVRKTVRREKRMQ